MSEGIPVKDIFWEGKDLHIVTSESETILEGAWFTSYTYDFKEESK